MSATGVISRSWRARNPSASLALLGCLSFEALAGSAIGACRRSFDQPAKFLAELLSDRSQIVERVQRAEFGERVFSVAHPAGIGFGDLDSGETQLLSGFGEGWLIAANGDRPEWPGDTRSAAEVERGEHVGDVLDPPAERTDEAEPRPR
jgi:hypothetical protein